ncbi:hypothetical protein F5882DRAFT_353638 [Hyaloscypha sp. PMI_1271]|nr:hypothetical protein F5882DRAFT_353638 [Hyaloscypha sp. PMI_1271]
MPLDPITALSLASNVIQFVDFGSKLLSKTRELHKSTTGALSENIELETITSDLKVLNSRLQLPQLSQVSGNGLDESEKALVALSVKCTEIADELLGALDQLKAGDDLNKKWGSFRLALKNIRRRDKIESIASRLEAFRQELESHILVSIRIFYQQFASNQTTFVSQQNRTNDLIVAESARTRIELVDTIRNQHLPESNVSRSCGIEKKPEEQRKRDLIEQSLLESLDFSTMQDRFDSITPRHARTFEWIYRTTGLHDRHWTDFPRWLSQGYGMYWVNGKAASGKSTLMRFIYDDPRTISLLKTWAGETPLLAAAHFFWNSGAMEQRSQIGLLRALLFKTIRQDTSLIPKVFPRHWDERIKKPLEVVERMRPESWTLVKLTDAFKLMVQHSGDRFKLFLHIDGLDEYDGDHEDIVNILNNISDSPNVKICLSSRPLYIFECSFKQLPGLRLQDLTFSDIKQYINDRLGKNHRMKELQRDEPREAPTLVEEIIRLANGVFLWVQLVVTSLLEGLRNLDHISDLQQRLRLLPPTLEELFKHILDRIDPLYFQQASRIFQIVRSSQRPTTTVFQGRNFTGLELSFAEERDRISVLQAETHLKSQSDLASRRAMVAIWLKTRCGGLLENHEDHNQLRPNDRLAYIHRTARDFLEIPEIWDILLKKTANTAFNASLSLVQSAVLFLKWTMSPDNPLAYKNNYHGLTPKFFASIAMANARYAEAETGRAEVQMLDELDRVSSDLVKEWRRPPDHWSNDESSRVPTILGDNNDFLSLAIKAGLILYTRKKLESDPRLLGRKIGQPYLHYTVKRQTSQLAQLPLNLEPGIVKLLFEYGATPNERWNGRTAWEEALQHIHDRPSEAICDQDAPQWLAIIKLFVANGADSSAQFKVQNNSISAHTLITRIFLEKYPLQTSELQRLLSNDTSRVRTPHLSSEEDQTIARNTQEQSENTHSSQSSSSRQENAPAGPRDFRAVCTRMPSRTAGLRDATKVNSTLQDRFCDLEVSQIALRGAGVSNFMDVATSGTEGPPERITSEAAPPATSRLTQNFVPNPRAQMMLLELVVEISRNSISLSPLELMYHLLELREHLPTSGDPPPPI